MRAAALVGMVLAITSCGETASPLSSAQNSTGPSKFLGGIYYVQPALDHPGGSIQLLNVHLPTPLAFSGIGYDILPNLEINPTPDTSGLAITNPDGSTQQVSVRALYRIGRPSLSGDGTQVAVQASETPMPAGSANPMNDTIYVVDIPQGTWHRVGDAPVLGDPSTQNEQPAFFPNGNKVAHWAAVSQCLVVQVRDAKTGALLLTIGQRGTGGCYQPQRGILDGPRFHIAVSADSTKILIPGQMQIYDSSSGTLLADIHQQVMGGLSAAGYQPDSRYPGAASAGTFPLSGSFSPDGKTIAFDGAVQQNGSYGEILAQIGVDGSGFKVLSGLIPANPQFSNNFNFSQLLPHWR